MLFFVMKYNCEYLRVVAKAEKVTTDNTSNKNESEYAKDRKNQKKMLKS